MDGPLRFSGEVFCWRGPAPHHFVRVPAEQAAEVEDVAAGLTYGWGVVPVTVTLGASTWRTSLIPKDGTYLVPVKLAVRRAERVGEGDVVALALVLGG